MRILQGRAAPVVQLRVSADGQMLAAIQLLGGEGTKNTLAIWDLHETSATPKHTVDGAFSCCSFTRNGDWLGAFGNDAPLNMFRMSDFTSSHIAGTMTDFLFLCPATTTDSLIIIEEFSVRSFTPRDRSMNPMGTLTVPIRLKTLSAWPDLTQDGTRLACLYATRNNPRAGHIIGIWDLQSQRLIERFSTRRRHIQELRFSPDGVMLAALASDQILVWQTMTKQRLAVLTPKPEFTLCMSFSTNGRELFVGTNEGLHVYDTKQWALQRRYDFGIGPITAVTVTADGLCGIAAGNTGRIVIWDLES